MPPIRHAGFAMLDVLVALLLLAVTLTGACVTLVQTMRATQGALLTTRAVDLATDLIEEARGVRTTEEIDALLTAWRARVGAVLPVTGLEPEQFASVAPASTNAAEESGIETPHPVLTLRWRGAQSGLEELSLPMAGVARPEAF